MASFHLHHLSLVESAIWAESVAKTWVDTVSPSRARAAFPKTNQLPHEMLFLVLASGGGGGGGGGSSSGSSQTTGTFSVTITGTSGAIQHSAKVNLTITP